MLHGRPEGLHYDTCDPMTIAGACFVLAFVAALAGYIPPAARRASIPSSRCDANKNKPLRNAESAETSFLSDLCVLRG